MVRTKRSANAWSASSTVRMPSTDSCDASMRAPKASIASTTDRTFVIRVRDGKTEWVDVRTGLTDGPLVEVFGDLRAGDEIAARGTDELKPGTDVRVKST